MSLALSAASEAASLSAIELAALLYLQSAIGLLLGLIELYKV